MAQVANLVHARTGLVFPEARAADVEATIRRAMQRRGLEDPDGLVEVLRRDAHAREALVAELTIGESYFMREPAQFELLRNQILPLLLRSRSDDTPIRMWSAGCAAGEEPFSMAMLCEEMNVSQRAYIMGSDIARPRLEDAQRGLYSRWALRSVSDATRQRYFRPRGRYFELTARIRQRVDFRYLNLADDTFPSLSTGIWGMDVIFCRNVLIYFDAATVALVARRLIASLSSEGWLVLAASDPPLGELIECDVAMTEAGVVYRRPGHGGDAALKMRPRPAAAEPAFIPPSVTTLPTAPELRSEPVAAPTAEAKPKPPTEDEVTAAYNARDFDQVEKLAARMRAEGAVNERVWVMWVRALANRGALQDAMRQIERALASDTSPELLYLQAVVLLQVGHTAEAAQAARRALYLDRNLIVAHLTLAEAQRRSGDAEAARRSLRNARRLLTTHNAGEVVPASDGERAGRLAELVSVKLQLLGAVREAANE